VSQIILLSIDEFGFFGRFTVSFVVRFFDSHRLFHHSRESADLIAESRTKTDGVLTFNLSHKFETEKQPTTKRQEQTRVESYRQLALSRYDKLKRRHGFEICSQT
jgi:hypothetical protein